MIDLDLRLAATADQARLTTMPQQKRFSDPVLTHLLQSRITSKAETLK
jgi:hypothetical protein